MRQLPTELDPHPVPQSPSPSSTPRSTRIQEEMRFKVLRALEQQPDLSQRQLADMLGVSLGKTNYLLRALLDKGLLKARNFRIEGFDGEGERGI
jgi:predicted HTH transcriptional regulator